MNNSKSWSDILGNLKKNRQFNQILNFIDQERNKGKKIFPPNQEIFNAFKLCNFQELKVVILGQDPYHNVNQAHGLAFSVRRGMKIPPSLLNIYKELHSDLDLPLAKSGDLSSWSKQGVFLLNTVLTVEAHQAHSHANKGWEYFTDNVVSLISKHKTHVVFMLWGTFAQKKSALIDNKKHLILKASHPSPLSASHSFFGCRHFSKANKYLSTNGLSEIDWCVV